MPLTEVKSPQLVRPGPIGLGIRVLLGALVSPRGVRPHLPTAVGAWPAAVFAAALAVSFPVAILTRSPGCELGALPWLLGGRQGRAAARPGCAVGLDRLDAWEAARRK